MTDQMKQIPWTEQMNRKAKELIENPEKYFKEARKRNREEIGNEKIPISRFFKLNR